MHRKQQPAATATSRTLLFRCADTTSSILPASSILLLMVTISLQPCAIGALQGPFQNRGRSGERSFVSAISMSDRILCTSTCFAGWSRRSFGGTSVVPPLAAAAKRGQDEEDEEELVRVPRRRRGGSEGANAGFDQDNREGQYYDEEAPPRRQGRPSPLYDEEEDEGYGSDYEDDDDYDDDDWALDPRDIDTAALLENVVIPNPLLDSIDPDGAADRFPELARDPRFWFDMALFIAFLNFLSWAGPRDPYPDLPWL